MPSLAVFNPCPAAQRRGHVTKKRGGGHLRRPPGPAGATLPECAELEGLPLHDAEVYDWVYDADSRHLVHEYWWVSAENEVDLVYRPTGRRARLVDSAWVIEP